MTELDLKYSISFAIQYLAYMTNCEASHSVPRFFYFLQNEHHLESVDKNTPTTTKHHPLEQEASFQIKLLVFGLGHTNKLTQKCTQTTNGPRNHKINIQGG